VADELAMMDGSEAAIEPVVVAVMVTLLVCLLITVIVASLVLVWSARAKRPRVWLDVLLAIVGVVCAEVCAIVAFMVLSDESEAAWAVALFAALALAALVGIAKRPVAASSSPR
jgi:hypothetical protein